MRGEGTEGAGGEGEWMLVERSDGAAPGKGRCWMGKWALSPLGNRVHPFAEHTGTTYET